MKRKTKTYKTLKQERKEFLSAVLSDKNEHAKMLYNYKTIEGDIISREVLTPYFKMMIKKCCQENKIKFLRLFLKYGCCNHGILIDLLQNYFSVDDNNKIYFNYSNSY